MKQLNRLFPNKVTIQLPQVSCYINLILQFIMLLTCYLQFIYLFRFQTCTGRGFTLWLEAAVRSWHWNYESSVQCCQHSLSESSNISLIIFNALSCCTFCVCFQFLCLFLDENSYSGPLEHVTSHAFDLWKFLHWVNFVFLKIVRVGKVLFCFLVFKAAHPGLHNQLLFGSYS